MLSFMWGIFYSFLWNSSRTSIGYFSNSTGPSVTSRRFFPKQHVLWFLGGKGLGARERVFHPCNIWKPFKVTIVYGLVRPNRMVVWHHTHMKKKTLKALRATSHTSQEPWPWNCASPKESVHMPSQNTSKVMYCGHGPSSEAMWLGPRRNAISMNFYSCSPSRNRISQWLWTFGVLWSLGSVLGLPPRGGFWK